MNKVRQMLKALEQELRKDKQYSAADKLLPIIEEAKKWSLTLCTDHNPEKSGWYVALMEDGRYLSTIHYSKKLDAWNCYDFEKVVSNAVNATAWMPLDMFFDVLEEERENHEN